MEHHRETTLLRPRLRQEAPDTGERQCRIVGLAHYRKQIRRHELVTHEQACELGKSIEAGLFAEHLLATGTPPACDATDEELQALISQGREAFETFVNANLRLVVTLSSWYLRDGTEHLDLIQDGNLGLIHAVEKWDYSLNLQFSTYATWWIRQNIARGIADTGRTVRLPVYVHEGIRRVETEERKQSQRLGRPATSAEVAVVLELETCKVDELMKLARIPVSLDTELDEGVPVAQALYDPSDPAVFDLAVQSIVNEGLYEALDVLSEREAGIIALRYGLGSTEPATLAVIGTLYGITRERVRQIELKALEKLRKEAVKGRFDGAVDDQGAVVKRSA